MPSPLPRRARRARRGAALLALVALLVGCSSDGRTLAPSRPDQTLSILTTTTTTAPVVTTDFVIYAPWEGGTGIPVDQTCDGAARPPSLTWAGVPNGALELAIVVTDLDATNRIHWIVAGLDPTVTTSVTGDALPLGALEGTGSGGTAGYEPLCPPPGAPAHRYVVDLYALGSPSGVTPDLTATDAVAAIQGAAVATASVSGTYQR